MEIVLIRHTKVGVPKGTCYGWSDVPLADTFLEEATETKANLEKIKINFDKVYSSPLSRAEKLAEYCGYPDAERDDRGTDIILYIDDDCKEFLEESRIQGLLNKYCRFLPVPVAFGKKKEWKDGKQVDTEEDNIINSSCPIWTKKPSELKDEDYKKFYRDLYPMSDEPLFWIHLNVDYPFNLTGVLYFPKIKSNIDLQKNKIQKQQQ
jgi:hypothetical protein